MIRSEYEKKGNNHGANVEISGSLENIKTEIYALMKYISEKAELLIAFSVALEQVIEERENDKNNSSN